MRVRNLAWKDALTLIAREHVLTQRHVLDEIGKPLFLEEVDKPDYTRLQQIAVDIFNNVPTDIAEMFDEPVERETSIAVMQTSNLGGVMFFEHKDPSGRPWVSVVGGLGVGVTSDDDVSAEEMHEVANELNIATTGRGSFMYLNNTLMHTMGAAHRIEPGMDGWKNLVAYLVVDQVAINEMREGVQGPATAYRELLEIGARSRETLFTPDEVHAATLRYKQSLSPELASVVLLAGTEDGATITVPFHADGVSYALSTNVTVLEGDSAGLYVMSRFYKQLDREHILSWCRAFNGDSGAVGAEDDDNTWPQTTPWSLGTWRMLELPHNKVELVFHGHVPHAVHEFVDVEDVIRGSIHEIWASSNRYRLHQEFEETITGSHGIVHE